jgi:hypothetical protein
MQPHAQERVALTAAKTADGERGGLPSHRLLNTVPKTSPVAVALSPGRAGRRVDPADEPETLLSGTASPHATYNQRPQPATEYKRSRWL